MSFSLETQFRRTTIEMIQTTNPALGSRFQTTYTPVEYSADSKALEELRKRKNWYRARPSMDAGLHEKLFRPDLYDPLSFISTDELLAYSKASGKQLVADVPDNFGSGVSLSIYRAHPTVESVVEDVNAGTTVCVMPDDSFAVVRSTYPFEARDKRFDRSALALLLHKAEEKPIPSLDDFSEYALHAPNPMANPISGMYILWFVPNLINEGQDYWQMLRFYGRLSQSSRSTLGTTGKINLGSLSVAEKQSLEEITYGEFAELMPDDPNRDPWATFAEFSPDQDESPTQDYREEPTEVAPSGLPSDGYLELKQRIRPFAVGVAEGYSSFLGGTGFGIENMAVLGKLRSRSARQVATMDPSIPSLKLGTQTDMSFTLHLAPESLSWRGWWITESSQTARSFPKRKP